MTATDAPRRRKGDDHGGEWDARQRVVLTDYFCKSCGQILSRRRKRLWVKSYCSLSGRTVRAWLDWRGWFE